MTRVLVLIALAVVFACPLRAVLVRANWTTYAPRAAILLWQAIAAAFVVAVLGAAICLASASTSHPNPRRDVSDFTRGLVSQTGVRPFTPEQLFVLTAGLMVATLLFGTVLVRVVGTLRIRAHQRDLIDLVGHHNERVPGAFIVEEAAPTAFSLLGLRSRVVVSRGAVDSLSADELRAVLAHERSHVHARHDLVMLPFRSLKEVLPRSRALASVHSHLASLVEMAADDQAVRECGPNALARALRRMSIAPDSGVRSEPTRNTERRIERLFATRCRRGSLVFGSGISALLILSSPFVAMFVTVGGR